MDAERRHTVAWTTSLLGHLVLGGSLLAHPAPVAPEVPHREVAIEAVLQVTRRMPLPARSVPAVAAPAAALPHRPESRRPAVRRKAELPKTATLSPVVREVAPSGSVAIPSAGVAPLGVQPRGEGADHPPDPGASSPTTLGGTPAPDPDTAALIRVQQMLAAAADHCYPRAARRFGLVGETSIHFCVDASGHAEGVVVLRSSGHDALDIAASECVVREAGPFPPLHRCVTVPIRFELRTP